MRLKLRRLRDERNTLAQSMHDIVMAAENEERGLTDEERSGYDAKVTELDLLDERISNVEGLIDIRSANLDDLNDEQIRSLLEAGADGAGGGAGEVDEGDARSAAFGRLIRSIDAGMLGLSQDDQQVLRAMAAGSGAAGGYSVPEGFGNQLFQTMQAYGGIARRATILNTDSGNDMPFPTLDETNNIGQFLAENVEDAEDDPEMGQTTLGAHKCSSKIVRVSHELLQDSALNIETLLTTLLAQRIGRAASVKYAVGDGNGVPSGLFPQATDGKVAALANAIAYAELVDLEHSVDPAYRMLSPVWVFNDNTLRALRGLVDANGIPLWQPNIADKVSATFSGHEYEVDNAAPDIAAGQTPIAFGDLKQFYIRRVKDVTLSRLVERYAEYHQVGFVSIARMDSGLMDTSAVKRLKMA